MPIYEYECTKCGHQAEVLQKFSDSPLADCEMCHGKMKKLISHNTFHLKGTGWYVTDYASKSKGTQEKSSKSNDHASGTQSKAPTETPKKKDPLSKDTKGASKKKGSSGE
ncbi:MAG: zinc ribbon domain-containing protein [Deltaproteobacteria bacterium]|nr:zinc ribbon domain-containing protein [Deltaproteobacteria bacterium]